MTAPLAVKVAVNCKVTKPCGEQTVNKQALVRTGSQDTARKDKTGREREVAWLSHRAGEDSRSRFRTTGSLSKDSRS